jgi:two-component system sensor histidine kinase MprB
VSLRARLTVSSAAIVGVILMLAGVVCFTVIRHELRGQIDSALRAQGAIVRDLPRIRARPTPPSGLRLPRAPRGGGVRPDAQLISRSGALRRLGDQGGPLPVDLVDRAIAAGRHSAVLRDRRQHGIHLRVLTVPAGRAGAIEFSRSLTETDATLSRLRFVLALLVLGGTALAALAARLFGRSVIGPITDLTRATEHIERTGDLDRRVSTARTDEVGKLAARFNAMLDRLEEARQEVQNSIAAQRQLVADASHELRTPLASLRTNLEVLLAGNGDGRAAKPPSAAMLRDIVEQTEELTSVVSDLIELARGDQPAAQPEPLDLAAIAHGALERARRHAPELTFQAELEPWPMEGTPDRLGRALNNILDNAAKHSPPNGTIHLTLHDGELVVLDEGPGVAADELAHIFNRFYRGRSAHTAPGSGLGLAIVKQVVESHGGTVTASTPDSRQGLRIAVRFD